MYVVGFRMKIAQGVKEKNSGTILFLYEDCKLLHG